MELIEEIIDVDTEAGPIAVLRKRPAGGTVEEGVDHPRVLMFHDGPGIRGATHEFAAKLASAGFDVAVPDLYHRHGRMIGYELHEREADPSLLDNLWAMLDSLDDDEIQADLDATLRAIGFDTGSPLATIGFCVGARAVYRTMMRLPQLFPVGAMWHPSYLADDQADSPHQTAHQLTGKLFIGIGAEDQMQSVADHQPFLDAVTTTGTADIHIYPGADHGYTWVGWPSYDQAAAHHSFDQTVALFKQHL